MPKIHIDLWLVETEAALWGLREYLDVIEEQITFVDAQRRLRLKADLIERGADWEEAEPEMRDLDMLVEHVFPRTFRAGFVVILWGTFEAGVAEIARGLARRLDAQLQLRDVRGNDFIHQAEKYFSGVIGFQLFDDPAQDQVMRDLLAVRNAFAHANGRLFAMNERTRGAVETLMRSEAGILEHWGDLEIDAKFCRKSFESVDACLRSLVRRARAIKREGSSGSGSNGV